MAGSNRFRIKFAVYLIPRDGDKVLVSLRQGTGWKDGWYSLIAGHVDGGEAAEQAMIREAYEEANMIIAPDDLRHVFTAHRLGENPEDEYIDLFFECHNWQGEIKNMEPHKCGDLQWVAIDSLPEKTLDYVAHVLNEYSSGKTYASVERN